MRQPRTSSLRPGCLVTAPAPRDPVEVCQGQGPVKLEDEREGVTAGVDLQFWLQQLSFDPKHLSTTCEGVLLHTGTSISGQAGLCV